MKRKAFLIASPHEEGTSNFLPGVTPDIKNMKKHLLSNAGGAWRTDEIEILKNPSRDDVLSKIQGEYDFIIIQYSGHGFEYTSTGTQLDINPKQKIGLEEIHRNISAPRRYYFIDCCRGIVPEDKQILRCSMENFSNVQDSAIDYRKRYEDIILSCEEGLSVIYSCDMKQSADEDPQGLGGIFTLSYINASKKHSFVDLKKYYSIKTIFTEANTLMKTNYPLSMQNPVMKPERRERYFPFII